VLLMHAAGSIAITAAEKRAEPRRVGRTTPVCHQISHAGPSNLGWLLTRLDRSWVAAGNALA
jgi:hypothetical protein